MKFFRKKPKQKPRDERDERIDKVMENDITIRQHCAMFDKIITNLKQLPHEARGK